MKKRAFLILLSLLLALSVLPTAAVAETEANWWEQDVWPAEKLIALGAVPPTYNAEKQQYEISMPEQLLYLSGIWKTEDTNGDGVPDAPCDGTYVLTADLDMAPLLEKIGARLTDLADEDIAGYMPPIAALADEKAEEGVHCAFFGTFDGQGHAIKNLRVVRMGSKYCGLFGNVGHDFGEGYVKNLAILDAEIIGRASCGILAGSVYGDVDNVVCTGTIDCAEKTAGGLAGKIKRNDNGYYGIARNCFVYADIVVRGQGNENGAAGGVTASTSGGGQVENCFVGGSIRVLGTDAESVAGVVGNLKGGVKVDNNVMMLTVIDGGEKSADVGLLCGSYGGESGSHLHGNYVWEGTKLLGGATVDRPADASYTEAGSAAITSKPLYDTLGWDFENTWTWVGDIDNGYPMLTPYAGTVETGERIAKDLTVTEPVLHLAEPTALSSYMGDTIAFSAHVLLPDAEAVTNAALHCGSGKSRADCTNAVPMTVSDGKLTAEITPEAIGTLYYYVTASTAGGETFAYPTQGTLRVDVISAAEKYAPQQLTVSPGATVSQVGINWITETDGLTGSLLLRKAGADAWEQTIPVTESERVNVRGDRGSFTSYSVDLAGLEPDTAYEYRAVTNDGTTDYYSATYSFTTLPADNSFSFVVVSDLQSTNEEGYLPYLYTYTGFMQNTLAPDFVVNLGDLTEDDTMAQWRYLFETLGVLQASTLNAYVPGNHESKGDVVYSQFKGRTNLPQGVDDAMLAESTGAFVVGDVCFVILNTEPYTGVDGADASADKMLFYELEKAWAKEVFEASGCQWRVVLAHAGLVQKDPVATAFLEQMCEELDVDLFFNGHIHDYFRATVNGAGEKAETGEATSFLTVSPMGEKFDDYGGEIDDLLDYQTGNSKDTRHYFAHVVVDDTGITVTVYRRVSNKAVTKKNCTEYEVIDSIHLASKKPIVTEAEPEPTEATAAPAQEPAQTEPQQTEPQPAQSETVTEPAIKGGNSPWLWIGICVVAIALLVLCVVLLQKKGKTQE